MLQSPALDTFTAGIRDIAAGRDDVLCYLTVRQMAVLFAVGASPRGATIRGLAADLNLTKPVVTRACDTLGRMGLTKRTRDPKDRRNVFVNATADGMERMHALKEMLS